MGRADDPLQRVFAPLIGLSAWFVRKGHGSMLTLEFGPPHLKVREPTAASPGVSERVRALLARRQVFPRGDWHLWIYCCNWRVLRNGVQLARSEACDEDIRLAAEEIDGQLLMKVEADPTRGASAFAFDLGASLETWPYSDGDTDEQWMLYMKSGDVFGYRGDGTYSLGAGTDTEDSMVWQPLKPRGGGS